MVLGDSSFWFRFRSIMLVLLLWSMDDKAEAEPKTALAEWYQWHFLQSNTIIELDKFRKPRITAI